MTPEQIAETVAAANDLFRVALQDMSLEALRWDFGCNIRPYTKQMILDEVARRGVTVGHFDSLGRGRPA